MKELFLCFLCILSVLICVYVYIVNWWTEPFIGTRNLCPTRNMSYDLRGDIPIQRQGGVWLNSEIGVMSDDPDMCNFRK